MADLREILHGAVSNYCGHEAHSDAGFSLLNDEPVCAVCLSIADAVLTALREAGALAEWRPIEEAPRDGKTLILLWGRYWSDSQGTFKTPLPGQFSLSRNCWEAVMSGWFGVRPTHWTPLPPAPGAAK